MDLKKINELLSQVALDHSADKPEEATQKIALALMHMAEGIHEIQISLVQLREQ
jgi:hypothetical protein